MKYIRLSSTTHKDVTEDLESIAPNYFSANFEKPNAVIAIIRIPDRIETPTVYDSETGEVVTQAVFKGELRFDVVLADTFTVPILKSKKSPENPDHKLF